jgi:acetyl/propionyl-CoA carboxylase alpha subunit
VKALLCGERRFEPVVRDEAGDLSVSLGEETFRFALEEDGAGVYVIKNGRRSVRFHLALDGDAVHLFWEGAAYTLEREREGARPGRRHEAGMLEAPMPGRVTAVKAEPGLRVAKGQELLVVEAMKMENALRAPGAGVVRAVHARVGDMVAPGRALVEIEAEP